MGKISETLKTLLGEKKISLEDVNKKIEKLEKSIKTKDDILNSGEVLHNPATADMNAEFAMMGNATLASSLERDKKKLEKLKAIQKELLESEENKAQDGAQPEV